MISSILKIIVSVVLVVLAVVSPNVKALELMPDTKVENGTHQTVTIKYPLRELDSSNEQQQVAHEIQDTGGAASDALVDTVKSANKPTKPLYAWVQEGESPAKQEVTYAPNKYFIIEDQEPGKAYVEYTPLYHTRLTVFDGQPLCVEGRDTGCTVNAWDAGRAKIAFHVPKGEAKKYLKKSI